MTKLEKVIAGLQRCCVDNCTEGSKCPYYSEKDCVTTLLYDALEVAKEQEPKPVLSPHIDRFCMRGFAEYIAYCPNCKQEILEKHNKSYCGFCGKAVKWE